MSQAYNAAPPTDGHGTLLEQAQAVIVEAAQYVNVGNALSVAQHLSDIDRMLQLSKMVLAGRHLMSRLHDLFQRFDRLENIEIEVESEAVGTVEDYVEFGLELWVRSSTFAPSPSQGAAAPPVGQMQDLLAVQLDLITQGITPELMRAALGVEGDASHSQVLSVSRSMFGYAQEPDFLAALYAMLPELPQLLRQSQGMLDFEGAPQPVRMGQRG